MYPRIPWKLERIRDAHFGNKWSKLNTKTRFFPHTKHQPSPAERPNT